MLKNCLIVFPTNQSKEEVCDFLNQTIKIVSRENHIYILDYTTETSIKEILLKLARGEKISLTKKFKQISYLTPVYLIPFRKNKFVKKANQILYFFLLQIFFNLKYKNLDKKIIWMFFPQLSFILKAKNRKWKTIYDIIDSYSLPNELEDKKLEKEKILLLKKADYIFSISQTLKKEFSKLTNKDICVVSQGFDVRSFKKITQPKIKLPTKKVKIGFIGQINQRIDFSLVNKLIQNNPQWNFIFIGPKKKNDQIFEKNRKIGKLINKKNCIWIDKKPKEDMPSIISQFDVAIIPYDMSLKFNRYCYPMKLFEYIYMNKPIVSTPIKELTLEKFKNIVFIGEDYLEWEKLIKEIIQKKPKINKKLAEINSWKNKIESISNKLINK